MSETDCGLEVPLSLKLIVAARAPKAVGVNRTTMEQLAPAVSEAGQLLFSVKSEELEPVTEMLVAVKVPEPELVKVTVWEALVMSTGSLTNVKLEGERLATPGAEVPVPERETVCGLALLETVSVADRLPLAEGLNATLMVQFELAARELPQLFVWVKSAEFVPEMEIPVIERDALPAFKSVTA